jgi:hypothetical protein
MGKKLDSSPHIKECGAPEEQQFIHRCPLGNHGLESVAIRTRLMGDVPGAYT